MLWTINMSCRSSMAPSIQLLKGAALLANSRCNWSIVSSSFSVLWRLNRSKRYQGLNTFFKALRCANTCKYVSSSIKCVLLRVLAAAGMMAIPACLWEAFSDSVLGQKSQPWLCWVNTPPPSLFSGGLLSKEEFNTVQSSLTFKESEVLLLKIHRYTTSVS